MTDAPLTIGELFPADDLIARWVYSASAVSEDVGLVADVMRTANEATDLPAMLFFYRQLVTRLYEARRLVQVADQRPEIAEFLQPERGKEGFWRRIVEARAVSRPLSSGSTVSYGIVRCITRGWAARSYATRSRARPGYLRL